MYDDDDRFERIRARFPIRDYLSSIGIKVDQHGKFLCVNPDGHDKNPSAKINDSIPWKWKCFGCQEHGDVVDLRALAESITLAEAADRFDGGNSPGQGSRPPPKPRQKPKLTIVRSDYGPIPDDAPKPIDRKLTVWREDKLHPGEWIEKIEEATHVFEYRDRNGQLQAYVLRVEFVNREGQKRKRIIPVRWNLTAKRFDQAGFVGKEARPLFNHDRLFQYPKAEVLVVEGEKTAVFAQAVFPDMVVISWIGGTGQVQESCYDDLKGRHVTLWGDNDPPGIKAMTHIASAIEAAVTLVVPMQAAWEPKWDVEDIAGLAPGEAVRVLQTRRPFTPDIAPPGSAIGMWTTVANGGWLPDALHPVLATNGLIKLDHTRNAEIVLTHHPMFQSLSWDVVRRRIVWQGETLGPDDSSLFMTSLVNQATRLIMSENSSARTIESVARRRPVNPLADQIRNTVWDKTKRVEALWTYLGLGVNSEWNTIAPKRWFLGLVNRILNPGAQSDLMLILEGGQGIGKTSALKLLSEPFGFPGYVSISGFGSAATLNNSDMMVLSGKILCEMSEMSAHRKAEADFFKGMLTKTEDRYRSPYQPEVRDHPRTASFAGTTNRRDAYLNDDTGGRRFVPCACIAQIDLDGLAQDRDQLYAEAAVMLQNREQPYFTGEEETLQDEEVKKRTAVSLIRQEVEAQLENYAPDVITPSILFGLLGIDGERFSEKARVKPLIDAAMAEIGWIWSDRTLLADGSRKRGWTRGSRKQGRPPKPRPVRPVWWPKDA